jgi:nitrate reductase gamma subunit
VGQEAVGVSESTYHYIAGAGGIAAGLAATLGFVILVVRRLRFPRVRVTTTRMDVAVFALLAFVIATGMWSTLGGTFGDEVRYWETVAPWFRSLFALARAPS